LTFERGFADVERGGAAAEQASKGLLAAAKQMHKAALEGDIARMRRASERLEAALDLARQEVANARSAWPYSPGAEEEYLRDEYEQELLDAAKAAGLRIDRLDERLVSFPSVIRIAPTERAVRIDRKKVSSIRPGRLVSILKTNQTKGPRFAPEKFLETLFRAYQLVTGKDGMGRTVPLSRIYEALTLLPGAASEYDRSDFGRDMFLLDRSGRRETKSGARLALPSTGRSVFVSFVSPEGETVSYYGISFSEAE
jgi:hypothetical protein